MVGNRDDASTNTFELCRAACGDSTYMALQYGGECFCSNSYGNGAQYVQVAESECNINNYGACAGNAYNCGGTWRQAIYQINNFEHWELVAHHDVAGGWFSTGARSTYLENQNNPDAATFMNIGCPPRRRRRMVQHRREVHLPREPEQSRCGHLHEHWSPCPARLLEQRRISPQAGLHRRRGRGSIVQR